MGPRLRPISPLSSSRFALPSALMLSLALGCAGASKGGGGAGQTGTPGVAGTGSGAAGTTGAAGSTGAAGTVAPTGAAGQPGAAGQSGAAGQPGVAGQSGPAGHVGGAGTTGAAGAVTTGAGGSIGTGAAGSSADAGTCQMANYKFEQKIPTVYILVDRSGTEFTNETTGIFFSLRTAVLTTIQPLDMDVRFGLGVFTGDRDGMCPTYDEVPTAIDNYDKIATAYNKLGRPQFKAETPAAQMILTKVKPALMADTGPGDKYMLFVTDGETDYCDDGDPACAFDSVTYAVQNLKAAGFGTLIVGLPSPQSQYAAQALQAWANAGAGLPVSLPVQNGQSLSAAQIRNNCYDGRPGYKAIWDMAGRTGSETTATYANATRADGGVGDGGATDGGVVTMNAPVYAPSSTDQTALSKAIAAAIAGVKSCSFDLGNINGQSIKVDLNQLGNAHIKIDGKEIALDTGAGNGWKMNGSTELELTGTACATWRMPNTKNIDFGFPCGTIIFE
jgi:hypothetical protein